MTTVSVVAHRSFIICCTSLLKSSQSTASSLRAMKLSRLFAPPKMTLRMGVVLLCLICWRTLLAFHDISCHICRLESAVVEEVDNRARRSSTLDTATPAGESPDDFTRTCLATRSFRTNNSSRYGSVEWCWGSRNCRARLRWWLVFGRRLSHQSHRAY